MASVDKLLFFSETYPCPLAQEESFILPELNTALTFCRKLVIIPNAIYDQDAVEDFKKKFPDITVNTRLSIQQKINRKNKLLKIFFLSAFWKDLFKNYRVILSPHLFKQIVKYYLNYITVLDWLRSEFADEQLSRTDVMYTYWFLSQASAIAKFKQEKTFTQISRAHGVDIFNERWDTGFIPLREQTLSSIDLLFPASEAGTTYLKMLFPKWEAKIKTAHLGIPNKLLAPQAYTKNKHQLNLLSCSNIIPLKRVDKLAGSIANFATLNPDISVKWTHVGSGEKHEEDKIKSILKDKSGRNLTVDLLGALPNLTYINFLQQNQFDLFITVSSTEGGCPVSIVEAQASGIPALGTSVGGIPEIVNSENGGLIPVNYQEKEFCDEIKRITSQNEYLKFREQSRINWERHFVSEKNHAMFYQDLQDFISLKLTK